MNLRNQLSSISTEANRCSILNEYPKQYPCFEELVELIQTVLVEYAAKGYTSVSFNLQGYSEKTQKHIYISETPYIKPEFSKCKLLDYITEYFLNEELKVLFKPGDFMIFGWGADVSQVSNDCHRGHPEILNFIEENVPELIIEY